MFHRLKLVGAVFGRLTVIREAEPKAYGHRQWWCQCSCGAQVVVIQQNLRRGTTRSCGCFQRDETIRRNVTHGQAFIGAVTQEYKIWLSMKQRCTNTKGVQYAAYGGRGITVCKEWTDSYEAFFRDMGPRPSPKHSIDRIDVNGDYEPSNCRWATMMEQMANTRRNRIVTYQGQSMHLTEAARQAGVSVKTVRARMDRGLPESVWFLPKKTEWQRKGGRPKKRASQVAQTSI